MPDTRELKLPSLVRHRLTILLYDDSALLIIQYPTFGSPYVAMLLSSLETSRMEACVRILILIHRLNDISYCPMLLPFIVMLQSLFQEDEIYFVAP